MNRRGSTKELTSKVNFSQTKPHVYPSVLVPSTSKNLVTVKTGLMKKKASELPVAPISRIKKRKTLSLLLGGVHSQSSLKPIGAASTPRNSNNPPVKPPQTAVATHKKSMTNIHNAHNV